MTSGTRRAVRFRSGDVELAGDEDLPDDPWAGVVLIGGSGPTDRSNGGYFDAYRDAFAAAGMAVLRYDKRGVGESSGDHLAGDFDTLAGDASAALAQLHVTTGGDVPVGLFGHSEGGWVAMRSAARDGAAFVITNSTPGIPPGLQDRHAIVNLLAAEDRSPQEREDLLTLYDALLDAAASGATSHHALRLIDASPAAALLTDYAGEFDARTWPFFAATAHADPLPSHRALRCPHLAIFGTADSLVPVAQSIAAFASSSCEPARDPRAEVTIRVVPAADHRLLAPGAAHPSAGHLAAVVSRIREAVGNG